MTTVSFPEVIPTFKNAIYEILSSYFDGQEHDLGGEEIDFPSAEVVFDFRKLVKPVGLTISLVLLNSTGSRRLKCHNPKQDVNGKHGAIMFSNLSGNLFVSMPSNDYKKAMYEVDRTWSLLNAIIECDTPAFTSRNICIPMVSQFPQTLSETHDIAVVMGSFNARVEYEYSRFN